MDCPQCGGDTEVEDRLRRADRVRYWRRRVCLQCRFKFVTTEVYFGATRKSRAGGRETAPDAPETTQGP